MIMELKKIGARCKAFRIGRGYIQSDVARDTGYTTENISAFETGRNDNLRIFLWYIERGMTLDEIRGYSVNGKEI